MKNLDRHGNIIQVGSLVRLVNFEPEIRKYFEALPVPDDERVIIELMLKENVKVWRIRDDGLFDVEKAVEGEDGEVQVQMLTVPNENIELVNEEM